MKKRCSATIRKLKKSGLCDRVMALLLCMMMAFTIIPSGAIQAYDDTSSDLVTYSDGVAVDEVILPQNERVTLTAGDEESIYTRHQWQILAFDTVWVDIAGADTAELELSYAMVASLLNEDGEATVRCKTFGLNGTCSNEVTVTVDYTAAEEEEVPPSDPLIPESSEATSAPESSEAASTPESSEETSTPESSEETSTPESSEATSTPESSEVTSTPESSEAASTPESSEAASTPESSEAASTPESSEETSTPESSEAAPETAEPAVETSEDTPAPFAFLRSATPLTTTAAAEPVGTFALTPPSSSEESSSSAPADEPADVPADDEADVPADDDTDVPGEEDAAPAAETGTEGGEDENIKKTYNVIINYVFENNEVAASPYTASLAEGSNFTASVTSPTVMGYAPNHAVVNLNITNIQADRIETVTYSPTNVNYTVIHYQQNADNDNYREVARQTKQGLTNSIIADAANNYDGFYALLYEKPPVAADGSTVIDIKYDRYYYLMMFELGEGGYGVNPVYARYESELDEISEPTRAGYEFQGWSKVDPSTNAYDAAKDLIDPANMPKKMPLAEAITNANGEITGFEPITYYAVWEAQPDAKVTVVFWGENADDEGYSYVKSSEVYVKADSLYEYKPGDLRDCGFTDAESHTHTAACGYDCGEEEHVHTVDDGCYKLDCTKTSHNHITDGCTLSCSHISHTVDCYRANANGDWSTSYELQEATPGQTINPTRGDGVYEYTSRGQTRRYLYVGGKWYCVHSVDWWGNATKSDTIGISLNCTHTHSDSCYGCGQNAGTHVHSVEGDCYDLICTEKVHTHSDECGYSCGKHEHTDNCYVEDVDMSESLWEFDHSETITVDADGSNIVNVYYNRKTFTMTFKYNNQTLGTVTDKWGANILNQFNAMCDLARQRTSGYSGWKDSTTGNYVDYIAIMPQTNKTLTVNTTTSSSTSTMTYYVEGLDGKDVELFKIQFAGSYKVTKDEYYEIRGFTVDLNRSTKTGSSCNGAKFYYTRNSYSLVFNDGYNNVRTESVKYEAPLSVFEDYVPEVPEAYPPGSVVFDGWYLNPECSGPEYDLSAHTMPAFDSDDEDEGGLILYAKWTPVNKTVEFYLTEAEYDAGTQLATHPAQTVPYGSKITDVATPANGGYNFVGWFYYDEEGEKNAFDFANMPITQDMKVFGVWSSNTLKNFFVYYVVKDGDKNIEIADPTTGAALAGTTKTFDAKGGEDLYENYREGYFPVAKSHSMLININSSDEEKESINTYTFVYVQKTAVPYLVRYVDENGQPLKDENGVVLVAEKVDADNRKAIVTEPFVPVSGYMPDAYQKRLVINGSDTENWIVAKDAKGNDVYVHPDNVIEFVYVQDKVHALYQITHYTQNVDGENWTEYSSSHATGDIGKEYSADPLTIPGFTFDSSVSGTVISGKLTDKGLELKLYYTRNKYPYAVNYLEEGTGKVLAPQKTGSEYYDKLISEPAISIANYTLVGPNSQNLVIRIEANQTAQLNIINFYYKENEATFNYVVKGPAGCGTVTLVVRPDVSGTSVSEKAKLLTGTALGATAAPASNFRFIGWFTNPDCTGEPISTDVKYWPEKTVDYTVDGTVQKGYGADGGTFYAKFDYDLDDLTIKKTGANMDIDENQTFIFHVVGSKDDPRTAVIDMKVVIEGNNSVTIRDLPVGSYTVTEQTSWSWRYQPDSVSKEITLNPSKTDELTFNNTRGFIYWLNGAAYAENIFGK